MKHNVLLAALLLAPLVLRGASAAKTLRLHVPQEKS